MKFTAPLGLTLLTLASAAQADEFFDDDVIITGRTCIGAACVDGETFSNSFDGQLKLKGQFTSIEFSDTSGSADADRDWRLRANLNGGGATGESFFLEDQTEGTTPFWIEGGTPSNVLYVDNAGRIGVNTSQPATSLHLVSGNAPVIRMENAGGTPSTWDLIGGNVAFALFNNENITIPLLIQTQAPTSSLVILNNGNVGIGTNTPDAPFEVSSAENFNYFRISATGATVNESVDITYTGGPLGTGQLRYNIVDGDAQEMSLDANGNMVLDGTLTTAGPTCAGGCDRVFEDDYALPSISTYQAQMYEAGYLPSIGATLPNAPVNLSERQGNIINSLEHAHIYIGELHGRLDAQTELVASLQADLAMLKTRIDMQSQD